MGYNDFIFASVPIFLSIFIPGVLLAFAILKKTRLSIFEILCFGFILGLIFPPLLSFLEALVGIKYSFELGIFNIILVSGASFAFCVADDAFPKTISFHWKRDYVWVLLAAVMIFAFWLRIQSIGPIFYEFDPYFYMYSTQDILKDGITPVWDYTAWYPYGWTHRGPPLTNYLTASWYSIYTSGGEYDNYLLSTISGIYPPVVGALTCFLIFVLISEGYGRKFGIAAALFTAVMPNLIMKFAAGEQELQPWGIFSSFFFFAAYAIAINRADRRLALLAGIAYVAVILGSTYAVVASLVMAGYIGLQSIAEFLRGRDLRSLFEVSGIVLLCGVAASIPLMVYAGGGNLSVPTHIAIVFAALLFCAVLWQNEKIIKKILEIGSALKILQPGQTYKTDNLENRINVLVALGILGLVFVFVTPMGGSIMNYVLYAAGFAKPTAALYQTVAEEAPSGGAFQSSLGYLGWQIKEIETNAVYVVLVLAALLLAGYAAFEKESKLEMLFAVMIFPVSYIGINKSKYMLQLGYMAIVGFGVTEGIGINGLEKWFKKLFGSDTGRKLGWAMFGVVLLIPVMQFYVVASDVIPVALDPSYAIANPADAKYGYWIDCAKISGPLAGYLYCSHIPSYWLEPMEWIRKNVGEEDRVISWWDYGHWINFFGQRNCVTRNEHANVSMDLEVADVFVYGNASELKAYMLQHKAKYALFDVDLISKWGALVYLACFENNETTFEKGPGNSACDAQHYLEYVYVPVKPDVSEYCVAEAQVPFVRGYSSVGLQYCIADVGQQKIMFYAENLTSATGRQNHGVMLRVGQTTNAQGRLLDEYIVMYDKDDPLSWADRKGKGYDSTFYQGFFLGELDGFEQVYPENSIVKGPALPVRIFKIIE